MMKAMLSLTAALSVAAVTPAIAAQFKAPVVTVAPSLQASEQRIEWQINRAEDAGRIDAVEAANMRDRLNQLENLDITYTENGMTPDEYADLSAQLRSLEVTADQAFYG
jgi:hypothetical protein